jgi:hypothetical protein
MALKESSPSEQEVSECANCELENVVNGKLLLPVRKITFVLL